MLRLGLGDKVKVRVRFRVKVDDLPYMNFTLTLH